MRTIAEQYAGKPFARRDEWEGAFHGMVRSTVEVHLLSRLQPALGAFERSLAEIDADIRAMAVIWGRKPI